MRQGRSVISNSKKKLLARISYNDVSTLTEWDKIENFEQLAARIQLDRGGDLSRIKGIIRSIEKFMRNSSKIRDFDDFYMFVNPPKKPQGLPDRFANGIDLE